MNSCMFSFGFQLISFELIANTSSAQTASWTFTEPCLLRILNQINYLNIHFYEHCRDSVYYKVFWR